MSSKAAASRLLLAASALCLAAGASLHALSFPNARSIADQSDLKPFAASAFKGLWLCDSVNSMAFALALGAIAFSPRLAGRPLVLLLALGPLTCAAAIYATMGNFFAGHVMLGAGLAALLGGLMRNDA